VQLDLGGMLAVLEQKQQTEKSKQSSKPVVFSGTGYDEIFFLSSRVFFKDSYVKRSLISDL